MLLHENLLFKKFNEIIILSPSIREFENLLLPQKNLSGDLNWEFIYKRLEEINVFLNIL